MTKSAFRLLPAGIVVTLGVLISACEGSATPGVASIGTTTTTTTAAASTTATGTGSGGSKRADGIKYAKCMREHGVENFPDPGSTGGTNITPSSGIDPNSPRFEAAADACKSLLPKPSPAQFHHAEQQALEFSKCMRAHGVVNFPDPTFSTSGATIKIIGGGSGLKPTSPTFQAAQRACSKYLHLHGATKQAAPAP